MPRDLPLSPKDGSCVQLETDGQQPPGSPTSAASSSPPRRHRAQELEEQLTHQAFHDALTGLANRALFTDRLAHALGAAPRTTARRRAVPRPRRLQDRQRQPRPRRGRRLLVDGRPSAFACLRADADTRGPPRRRRVRDPARGRRRTPTAADRSSRGGSSTRWPSRSRSTATRSRVHGEHRHRLAAGGRSTASELLRNADVAMYRAKGDGKGRFARLRAGACTRASCERLELEADLRRAVERDELVAALPADRRRCRPAASSASRRWCAGSTRSAACFRPASSSRSPRRPGSSSRSAAGCSSEACRQAARLARSATPIALAVSASTSRPPAREHGHRRGASADARAQSGLDAAGARRSRSPRAC